MINLKDNAYMIESLAILVVDDDAMVRNIVVEYLHTFGFKNIIEAKDGAHALKIVRDKKVHIDLVLSDWEMPSADGLTLLKAVRNDPTRSGVKFIMVTSQNSRERMKITQASQWKVNAYIIKPFKGKVLKEKIWSVLGWNGEEGGDDGLDETG